MRTPVPRHEQCEPTIWREARYWSRVCRGVLTVDDLVQEGRKHAHEYVLIQFDPERGVKFETLLTLAIRRHFRRLIRVQMTRALLSRINGSVEPSAAALTFNAETITLRTRSAREVGEAALARALGDEWQRRLAALPPIYQQLASALLEHDGVLTYAARDLGWSTHNTRRRVQHLRAMLSDLKG